MKSIMHRKDRVQGSGFSAKRSGASMLTSALCAWAMMLLCATAAWAGEAPKRILLWPDGAPMAANQKDTEVSPDKPTLDLHIAEHNPTGAAVVICPGGGYGWLAMSYEGQDVAEWYKSLGVTAFVLRYRHAPGYHYPVPLLDVQRAMRWVRAHAEEYHLNVKRIGVMGFSAGGHLASMAATHFDDGDAKAKDPIDRVSSRPDFAVLCYAVITMTNDRFTHQGSRSNLLGDKVNDQKLRQYVSSELAVTKATPPVFIFQTDEDGTVPPENAALFYMACHEKGVPAELHIFRKGQHGVGMAQKVEGTRAWPGLLATWLREGGLMTAKTDTAGS